MNHEAAADASYAAGLECGLRRETHLHARTVMMIALLAMFGLLPMALSRAIGAETQKPLAVVAIGGLTSATVLTLQVLPALYYWFNSRKAGHA